MERRRWSRVKSVPFDILVTDMKLPGIDGTTVLQEALALYPELIGIIITGYGTVGECSPGHEERGL